MVGKAILVVESPFSNRDFRRMGVEVFRSRGLAVEVWDLSRIYLPGSRDQWIEVPPTVEVKTFFDLGQVDREARLLGSESVVVLFFAYEFGQTVVYQRLLRALSRSKAVLTAVSAGQTMWEAPFPTSVNEHVRKTITIRSSLRRLVQRGGAAGMTVRALARALLRLRPLDHVWVGTSRNSISPLLVGNRTVTQKIHAFDYDLVLDWQIESSNEQQKTVFIDTMGPLHPDWASFGGSPYRESPEEFFRIVTDALRKLESSTGRTIEVAAHPRATPGSLDSYYADFVVHYGRTAWALANADLVVALDPSTTIGMDDYRHGVGSWERSSLHRN